MLTRWQGILIAVVCVASMAVAGPGAAATVAPKIASFAPASGPVGSQVVITGTGFTGTTRVLFNGTPSTFRVASATQITATVPAGATSGNIKVVNASSWSWSPTTFRVTSGWAAGGFTSSVDASNTTHVRITGTGLAATTAITLNGVTVPFTLQADGSIDAVIPFGGQLQGTLVVRAGSASVSKTFGSEPLPVIDPIAIIPDSLVYLSGSISCLDARVFVNQSEVNVYNTLNEIDFLDYPNGTVSGPVTVLCRNWHGSTLVATIVSAGYLKLPYATLRSVVVDTSTTPATIDLYGSGMDAITKVTLNGVVLSCSVDAPGRLVCALPTGTAASGVVEVLDASGYTGQRTLP